MIKFSRKKRKYGFRYFFLILIFVYVIICIKNSLPINSTYVCRYIGELVEIRKDVRLNVYDSKSGRKSLIFIHGDWMGLDSWKAQIDYFSQSYRVIAFDRIDCGFSEYNNYNPTHDSCVEDIRLLIEKLNLDEYVIIGHSRGQQMALLYTILYGGKNLKGLELEGIFPPEIKADKAYKDAVKAKWLDFFRIINLRKIQVNIVKQNFLSDNLSFKKKSEIIDMVGFYASKWRYEAGIISGTKFDIKDDFKKIEFPVLIINGADYRKTVDRNRYAEMFSENILITVDGAAHFVHLEKTDTFNEFVRLYLRDIEF